LSREKVSSRVEHESRTSYVDLHFKRQVLRIGEGRGEIDPVAKERERGESTNGTTEKTGERFPGEGCKSFVEDKESVFIGMNVSLWSRFGSVKFFQSFSQVDHDL
jgi:hypothetical protein